jgi:hypothetical protein
MWALLASTVEIRARKAGDTALINCCRASVDSKNVPLATARPASDDGQDKGGRTLVICMSGAFVAGRVTNDEW